MNLEKIKQVVQAFESDIKKDSELTLQRLDELRLAYLGKNGSLTSLSKAIKEVPKEMKREFGQSANKAKQEVTATLNELKAKIEAKVMLAKLESEKIDVTAPGYEYNLGTKHVSQLVKERVLEKLLQLGFEFEDETEIETEDNNFNKLNVHENHPARDMQDTFYLDNGYVLRTHATPSTAKALQKHAKLENKEFASVSIGKVYRRDVDDATHSHQFMQVDCCYVAKDASIATLKGTIMAVLENVFNQTLVSRLRPSFFPFTEPSIEFDIQCTTCDGKGCAKCKNTGWIEILGCGMLNDTVMQENGYDPAQYKGFAFGIGLERITMLHYEISDIREFYVNDMRFNQQFKTTKKEINNDTIVK